MLKHFLNPPNWFTSASLFCGLFSIVISTGTGVEQDFYRAGVMLLFAGVFDMLDGRVARITRTGSAFGVQLDSLADVVSFGLAPAILMYAWGLHTLGLLGLVAAFVFALCAAFRLARFNLSHADGKTHAYVDGLSVPAAGGALTTLVMAHAASGRTSVEHPVNVLLLTVVLSFLMVSRVQYRTFKAKRSTRATVIGFALFSGALLALAVRFNVSTAFVTIAMAYVVSGPLEAVIRRGRRRRPDEEPHPGL